MLLSSGEKCCEVPSLNSDFGKPLKIYEFLEIKVLLVQTD